MSSAPANRLSPEETAVLVRAAVAGDQNAWDRLVEGYAGLVAATVRRFRLGDSDVTDITQTTWLRLVQYIDRIDDPARVGAWLATTARREALRVIDQRKRVLPTESNDILDRVDATNIDLTARLIADERNSCVARLLDGLGPRYRQLLNLLMSDPVPSYAEISAIMDMPVGSIGPTRGRCLQKLASLAEEYGIELHELASV